MDRDYFNQALGMTLGPQRLSVTPSATSLQEQKQQQLEQLVAEKNRNFGKRLDNADTVLLGIPYATVQEKPSKTLLLLSTK